MTLEYAMVLVGRHGVDLTIRLLLKMIDELNDKLENLESEVSQ